MLVSFCRFRVQDTQPEDAEAQKVARREEVHGRKLKCQVPSHFGSLGRRHKGRACWSRAEASDLGWSKLSMGLTEDARDEFHGLVERRPSAQAFTSRGIANLLLGDHEAAIQDFSQAIELARCCSEAYNNRGIAREIQGDEGALADYRRADELAKTPEQREKLMQVRKWKPFGWEKGRKEAKGETEAKNADFLISFASPDAHSNNEILHQLAKAVHFQGKLRSSTAFQTLWVVCRARCQAL